jgi:acyl-CoA synthetase (AMP-forming)/AMP-acid ligase II
VKILTDQLGSIRVEGGEIWTTERLSKEVDRRTKILSSLTIGRADKVLILHGGSPVFFADLLAVWNVGACAACLNPNSTEHEVNAISNLLKPKAALVVEDQDNFSGLDINIVNLSSKDADSKINTLSNNDSSHLDDNALILFTSGTTGTPKGVVHTFRSLISRITLNQSKIPKDDFRITLAPLPTHFGHGLIGNCLTPLLSGNELILASGNDLHVVARLGEIIDEYKVTFISSVPAMWKLAIKMAKPPKKESLCRIHIGSAPLSSDLWKEVIEWSGIRQVVNMYGITETANWLGGASASEMEVESGLIGNMWGGFAAIRTANGIIKSQGSGEILVQTPSLMSGYYKLPNLNKEVMVNGWFCTGDIGNIDENGVIRLTGRKKFEINRAGLKVHPEDIDILLERHHLIQEACAFGIPDTISGEIVAVAISTVEEKEINLNELREWCCQYLVREKVPEKWFVLDEIPKTDRGKINRDIVAAACQK